MNAIESEDLHKRFGSVTVLQGVSFNVSAGQGAVLLGANGCGKSTLMRCLNGLERPSAGSVRIYGEDLQHARRRTLRHVRRDIGVVFQRFNLVSNLSVFQNVLYGAAGRYRSIIPLLAPLAGTEERERAMASLERVGLADRAVQRADRLSGGQQQRVAIARMLMQRPRLVLADEPVASLDPKAARQVLELLWGVVQEEQLTLLCTLHQLDFALEFGERVVGMKAGHVVLDQPMHHTLRSEMESLYEGQITMSGPAGELAEPALQSA